MTGGGHGGPAAQPCLFLLFPEGARPTASDVRAALAQSNAGQISFDPADRAVPGAANDWLELLASGLAFDLLGLAPGESLAAPAPRHHLGVPAGSLGNCQAIGIAPGPHLAGAASALPVVRAMLGLAAELTSRLRGCAGLLWHPSASATAPDTFIDLIASWLGGGPFPVLALTGMAQRGERGLETEGLAFFTGQELVLDPMLSADGRSAARIIMRLVDWLVEQRPLREPVSVALDDGARLRLEPSGARVHVSAD